MRHNARNDSAVLRSVSRTRRTATGRRRLVARKGFTLPELIVSMIIMSVGILALATGSAGVLRQIRAGNQAAIASMVATSRMEILRSKTCGALFNGTATTRGLAESWRVTRPTAKMATVAETVSYVPRAGRTSKIGVNVVIPCK